MRWAVSILTLTLLLGACGGGDDDPEPTAAPTATPEPSALAIWQTTLASLERVTSVRTTVVADSVEDSVSVVFPRYGETSDPDYVPWNGRTILPLFKQTRHVNALPSLTEMRILREERFDGRTHWVIGFSGQEGGIDTVEYYDATAWIDRETFLISRLETLTTRILGVGGSQPLARPSIIEYSEYETGTPTTPTPEATATPPAFTPPTFRLEPSSGRCNAEVHVTGSGLTPAGRFSVSTSIAYLSEYGEVEDVRVSETSATVEGEADITLPALDDWCASPHVALHQPILVVVVASVHDDVVVETLPYRIEPCETLGLPAVEFEAFCYNESPAGATTTPTPR